MFPQFPSVIAISLAVVVLESTVGFATAAAAPAADHGNIRRSGYYFPRHVRRQATNGTQSSSSIITTTTPLSSDSPSTLSAISSSAIPVLSLDNEQSSLSLGSLLTNVASSLASNILGEVGSHTWTSRTSVSSETSVFVVSSSQSLPESSTTPSTIPATTTTSSEIPLPSTSIQSSSTFATQTSSTLSTSPAPSVTIGTSSTAGTSSRLSETSSVSSTVNSQISGTSSQPSNIPQPSTTLSTQSFSFSSSSSADLKLVNTYSQSSTVGIKTSTTASELPASDSQVLTTSSEPSVTLSTSSFQSLLATSDSSTISTQSSTSSEPLSPTPEPSIIFSQSSLPSSQRLTSSEPLIPTPEPSIISSQSSPSSSQRSISSEPFIPTPEPSIISFQSSLSSSQRSTSSNPSVTIFDSSITSPQSSAISSKSSTTPNPSATNPSVTSPELSIASSPSSTSVPLPSTNSSSVSATSSQTSSLVRRSSITPSPVSSESSLLSSTLSQPSITALQTPTTGVTASSNTATPLPVESLVESSRISTSSNPVVPQPLSTGADSEFSSTSKLANTHSISAISESFPGQPSQESTTRSSVPDLVSSVNPETTSFASTTSTGKTSETEPTTSDSSQPIPSLSSTEASLRSAHGFPSTTTFSDTKSATTENILAPASTSSSAPAHSRPSEDESRFNNIQKIPDVSAVSDGISTPLAGSTRSKFELTSSQPTQSAESTNTASFKSNIDATKSTPPQSLSQAPTSTMPSTHISTIGSERTSISRLPESDLSKPGSLDRVSSGITSSSTAALDIPNTISISKPAESATRQLNSLSQAVDSAKAETTSSSVGPGKPPGLESFPSITGLSSKPSQVNTPFSGSSSATILPQQSQLQADTSLTAEGAKASASSPELTNVPTTTSVRVLVSSTPVSSGTAASIIPDTETTKAPNESREPSGSATGTPSKPLSSARPDSVSGADHPVASSRQGSRPSSVFSTEQGPVVQPTPSVQSQVIDVSRGSSIRVERSTSAPLPVLKTSSVATSLATTAPSAVNSQPANPPSEPSLQSVPVTVPKEQTSFAATSSVSNSQSTNLVGVGSQRAPTVVKFGGQTTLGPNDASIVPSTAPPAALPTPSTQKLETVPAQSTPVPLSNGLTTSTTGILVASINPAGSKSSNVATVPIANPSVVQSQGTPPTISAQGTKSEGNIAGVASSTPPASISTPRVSNAAIPSITPQSEATEKVSVAPVLLSNSIGQITAASFPAVPTPSPSSVKPAETTPPVVIPVVPGQSGKSSTIAVPLTNSEGQVTATSVPVVSSDIPASAVSTKGVSPIVIPPSIGPEKKPASPVAITNSEAQLVSTGVSVRLTGTSSAAVAPEITPPVVVLSPNESERKTTSPISATNSRGQVIPTDVAVGPTSNPSIIASSQGTRPTVVLQPNTSEQNSFSSVTTDFQGQAIATNTPVKSTGIVGIAASVEGTLSKGIPAQSNTPGRSPVLSVPLTDSNGKATATAVVPIISANSPSSAASDQTTSSVLPLQTEISGKAPAAPIPLTTSNGRASPASVTSVALASISDFASSTVAVLPGPSQSGISGASIVSAPVTDSSGRIVATKAIPTQSLSSLSGLVVPPDVTSPLSLSVSPQRSETVPVSAIQQSFATSKPSTQSEFSATTGGKPPVIVLPTSAVTPVSSQRAGTVQSAISPSSSVNPSEILPASTGTGKSTLVGLSTWATPASTKTRSTEPGLSQTTLASGSPGIVASGVVTTSSGFIPSVTAAVTGALSNQGSLTSLTNNVASNSDTLLGVLTKSTSGISGAKVSTSIAGEVASATSNPSSGSAGVYSVSGTSAVSSVGSLQTSQPTASGSYLSSAVGVSSQSGVTGVIQTSGNIVSQASPSASIPTATIASGSELPSIAATTPPTTAPAIETSSKSLYPPTGPRTQVATGTDTYTTQQVPSSIVAEPTASEPTGTSNFGPTGVPSQIPRIIGPPGGVPVAPENTTLCQIGFLYPLNYKFVVANPLSQMQIFKFLPEGIAYGLDISLENVTMQTLRAWDSTQDLGFITTLALFFIPSPLVDTLSLQLHTHENPIYRNPDNSVRTLFSLINPSFPIRADNTLGASPSTGNEASSSSSGVPTGNEGAPIGGSVDNSLPVRPSSVGIAAGVVCGAAAYGAAMFFVARRYRKRKQSHRRSPSMLSSPVMSGISHEYMGGVNTALMSGGRGDGDRSATPLNGLQYGRDSRGSGHSGSTGRQQISAPVMAENSLGWN